MRRGRLWVAVVVLAIVGAVLVTAERIAPPLAATAPRAASSVAEPVSGSSVCAVGDGRGGSELTTVAARPGSSGARPASVEVVAVEDGAARPAGLPRLFPGADQRTQPRGSDELMTWVRWTEAPVAVWREWRWNGAGDLPAATIAGGCARPFSDSWVIPGMSTVGGHEARIRLANPFRTDATVAVGFVTPEGAEEPLSLRNVTVSARSVREVLVNDILPEREDLAAVVQVATGRVAVEGYQIARAEIGGIDAGSLLSAAPESSEEWTVPWVSDGEDAASWLWVVNLGDRTAPVELTLHTSDGGQVPDGLAELSVPPGELRRVDLRGTLPEGATSAAVTVRSNGAPVVVSAASQLSTESADQTAFPIQLGAPATARNWVVSGGSTADRLERLRLVNPGGTDATVDIALFNGTTLLRPAELQGIELAAGSARTIGVHEALGSVEGWTAFATAAGGEIVVGRVGRSTGDQGWHFIATLGVPGSSWAPAVSGLTGIEQPGLVRRLGTASGLDTAPELPGDDTGEGLVGGDGEDGGLLGGDGADPDT